MKTVLQWQWNSKTVRQQGILVHDHIVASKMRRYAYSDQLHTVTEHLKLLTAYAAQLVVEEADKAKKAKDVTVEVGLLLCLGVAKCYKCA